MATITAKGQPESQAIAPPDSKQFLWSSQATHLFPCSAALWFSWSESSATIEADIFASEFSVLNHYNQSCLRPFHVVLSSWMAEYKIFMNRCLLAKHGNSFHSHCNIETWIWSVGVLLVLLQCPHEADIRHHGLGPRPALTFILPERQSDFYHSNNTPTTFKPSWQFLLFLPVLLSKGSQDDDTHANLKLVRVNYAIDPTTVCASIQPSSFPTSFNIQRSINEPSIHESTHRLNSVHQLQKSLWNSYEFMYAYSHYLHYLMIWYVNMSTSYNWCSMLPPCLDPDATCHEVK